MLPMISPAGKRIIGHPVIQSGGVIPASPLSSKLPPFKEEPPVRLCPNLLIRFFPIFFPRRLVANCTPSIPIPPVG